MVDIAKKLGEMWRTMETDVRKEWEDKATSAKDNYLVGPLSWRMSWSAGPWFSVRV